jgi:hypothetical protein
MKVLEISDLRYAMENGVLVTFHPNYQYHMERKNKPFKVINIFSAFGNYFTILYQNIKTNVQHEIDVDDYGCGMRTKQPVFAIWDGGEQEKVISSKSIGYSNNDGQSNCLWCGAATKKVHGFNSTYDVCTKCGK